MYVSADIQELGDFHEPQAGITVDAAVSAAKTGNTLYLSDPTLGIFVLDVSNPANMTMAGLQLFAQASAPYGIDLQGDILYAATTAGLALYDIEDPLNPAGLFALSMPVDPAWVKVSENTALVAMEGMIAVVDITKPSDMSISYAFAASRFDDDGQPALGIAGIPAISGTQLAVPFSHSGALIIEGADVINTESGKGRKLTFTDGNGVEVTISISVDAPLSYIVDADTGLVQRLVIGDVDDPIDQADKAKVKITTKGGDFSVVDVDVYGSLDSFDGKTTDLLGDMTVTGTLKKLTLDDVTDQHTITIGPAANASDTLTVTFDRVVDLTFTSQTPVKTFTVTDWLDTDVTQDELIAPWLLTLKTRGNSREGIAGHFQAGLTLSGEGDPALTLKTAKIVGNLGSGDAENPVEWDITGDIGTIDASKGTVEGWILDLHSDIKTLKLGLVEQAQISVGNAKTVSASQWNKGGITGESIKKFTTKANSKLAGADGDMKVAMTLTGSAGLTTLSSAKIAGDLGSGDSENPIEWDIIGDVGTIDASKGTVEGWTLDLHSSIKTLKLGLVEQAQVSVGDAGTVSASQWNKGGITGDSIKKFTTKANSKLAGANGDMKVDMTLTGSADPSITQTLGKATVAGRIFEALWSILAGDVGSITAGLIESSQIRIGIDAGVATDELPGAPGDFAEQSSLGKVTVKGIKGQASGTATFLDSILAAWQIGSVKLKVVDTTNAGTRFGLAGDTMKSVAGEVLGGEKFPKLSSLDLPADSFDETDFSLVLV